METVRKWLALLGHATVDIIADILEISIISARTMMRRAVERKEFASWSETVRGPYYRCHYTLPGVPFTFEQPPAAIVDADVISPWLSKVIRAIESIGWVQAKHVADIVGTTTRQAGVMCSRWAKQGLLIKKRIRNIAEQPYGYFLTETQCHTK